jgi:hypothetical protein
VLVKTVCFDAIPADFQDRKFRKVLVIPGLYGDSQETVSQRPSETACHGETEDVVAHCRQTGATLRLTAGSPSGASPRSVKSIPKPVVILHAQPNSKRLRAAGTLKRI